MKDIIMEVELQQRNHQLDDLLGVLDEPFLQLFSIAHLRRNTDKIKHHPRNSTEPLLQHIRKLVSYRAQN